jgi:hypothetical protein
MDSITQILMQASADSIEHLGVTVFIRGVEYKAIFRDEEYEDDVGRRRILTLSVDQATSRLLMPGDSTIVCGESFKIHHIPTTTDPLVEMDLKNA